MGIVVGGRCSFVPLPSTDGTCWATNTAERPPPHVQPTLSPPPYNQISAIHRPAPLRYDRHTDGRPWSASPRLFGRDASLCRSLRHVMCVRRHRSTPDSPEYSDCASLHDCYRYIMERGSETLPSEAPNRADEWSFFLCCVVDRFFRRAAVRPSAVCRRVVYELVCVAVCARSGEAPSFASRRRFSGISITSILPSADGLAIDECEYCDDLYCL